MSAVFSFHIPGECTEIKGNTSGWIQLLILLFLEHDNFCKEKWRICERLFHFFL
jgi:hypothetical protein